MSIVDIKQGSKAWLKLRKSHITATDANVIMGVSPWKTLMELYNEKISDEPPEEPNERMKRGIGLEPTARNIFILETGIYVEPKVYKKDWALASLDGISEDEKVIVEIKCPGQKDHSIAMDGKIPDHYYPQIQHQIYVTGVDMAYYFSFDGSESVLVEVERNEPYIQEMIKKEEAFYQCLINKIPPQLINEFQLERIENL